jgi:5-methyltetrahydrofolate--homocysteine methyltransferase
MWNVEHPERIRSLYQGAVDAGSDLFLTNSFGGNASRLRLHGAAGRVGELNRVAAEIGARSPTAAPAGGGGGLRWPDWRDHGAMGTLTPRGGRGHVPRAGPRASRQGGVDVLWVETISAAEEFRAAAEAFALADCPGAAP